MTPPTYNNYLKFDLKYKEDGSFTIAAAPRQLIHSRFRVPRDSWPYFTASYSGLPQPGGPGPRIYIGPESESESELLYD
jgi:hypothetical protein